VLRRDKDREEKERRGETVDHITILLDRSFEEINFLLCDTISGVKTDITT